MPTPSEPRLTEALAVMKRLHEMTAKAISAQNFGDALDEILNTAIDLSSADLGNIQLYDPERRQLRIVAHRGFMPEFLDAFEVVDSDDDTACGRALRNREACLVNDVLEDEAYVPYRDLAANAGYRAVQSIPLVCLNGELVGILSMHFRDPHSFSDWETLIGDLAAQQAADLISSRQQRKRLSELNEELRRRNDELAARDRNKNAFLATLGHELRNPLAAIHNGLSIITASDQQTKRAVAVVRRQSEQLIHLVNDLLDLGRVVHGKFGLKRKVIDLRESAKEAADANRHRIEARGLILEVRLPDEPIHVEGDRTRIMQVLDNLLDNALRFTSQGSIAITVRRKQGCAFVTIRDTGAGIDHDDAANLFEPFYQTKRGDSGAGSLGFGLALVKNIVEMHGGDVDMHSGGLGTGSEFVLTLPLAESQRESDGSRAPTSTPCSRSRSVLVVDDDRDNADMFAALLGTLGQEVLVAYGGVDALEVARTQRPEVAFLDLSMPGMDGRELARRLRKEFPQDQLTIVALTGFAPSNAPAPEFARYMVKPATIDAVVTLLASLDTERPRGS